MNKGHTIPNLLQCNTIMDLNYCFYLTYTCTELLLLLYTMTMCYLSLVCVTGDRLRFSICVRDTIRVCKTLVINTCSDQSMRKIVPIPVIAGLQAKRTHKIFQLRDRLTGRFHRCAGRSCECPLPTTSGSPPAHKRKYVDQHYDEW